MQVTSDAAVPVLPYETPSADSGGGTLPHMTQLDGLRAIAVMLVLCEHFLPNTDKYLTAGNLGVKLFFVLSGFLITGILLNCRQFMADGRQGFGFTFRRFYIRRALRIFPLYYAVLAAAWALNYLDAREHFAWYALYGTNFFVAKTLTFPSFAHFWTLAVEEQFYLLWPAVILLTPRKWLLPMVIAVVLSGPGYREIGYLLGWSHGQTWLRMYLVPIACLDSLGIGALLAVCMDRNAPHRRLGRWVSRAGFWIGVPGTILVFVFHYYMFQRTQLFARALAAAHLSKPMVEADLGWAWAVTLDFLISLGCAWAVARAAAGFRGVAGYVLSWRPIVAVGAVSYGIYVLHPLVQLNAINWFVLHHRPIPRVFQRFVMLTILSIAAAMVSWYLLEKPLNNLKRKFPYAARGSQGNRAALRADGETAQSTAAATVPALSPERIA